MVDYHTKISIGTSYTRTQSNGGEFRGGCDDAGQTDG